MSALLKLFRVLASFSPERQDLRKAPWEDYVDWAIAQGLAPLTAYNLEYRLGGAGAPEWARDRMLSIYQGALNDNVMKLVNFKRAVGDLEGRSVVVWGDVAFADSLYPHVAFRPVSEVRLWVPAKDEAGLVGFLGKSDFKVDVAAEKNSTDPTILTDGRTQVLVHTTMTENEASDASLWNDRIAYKVYGPSMFRLSAEDALVTSCLMIAHVGFDVPMLNFIDLRELVMGAQGMSGPYGSAVSPEKVQRRSVECHAQKAVYASLQVVSRLFPETAEACARCFPDVAWATRQMIDMAVVEPLSVVGRTREMKGTDKIRQLLMK